MLENHSEEMQLAECEAAITKGMKSFYYVGESLAKIRIHGLYKVSGFNSFKEYCSEKWKMEEAHATRLIQSYNVIVQLQLNNQKNIHPLPIGNESGINIRPELSELTLPVTESQARPLAKIKDPEVRAEAWDKVVEQSKEKNEPITAKAIERIVKEFIPDEKDPMEHRICSYLTTYNHNRFIKAMKGAKEAEYLRDIVIDFLDKLDTKPVLL